MSMINRQEVAKLLRKAGKNAGDWCDSADEAFEKVDTIIGTYDSCKYSDFFSRLADLIDPTCELKIQDGHACCGNCGHILAGEYEAEEDYWCFRPYCPDCGARVALDGQPRKGQ